MPSSESTLQRHDLVWLDEARWRDALQAPLRESAVAALSAWFARGRPAVVRRRESAGGGALHLGVALPPTYTDRKVPLVLDAGAVKRTSPPLSLDAVIHSAPPSWRPPLVQLATEANAIGIDLRVYGSLAWQHLSGEQYLTASSDVDLLWRAHDRATLEHMLGYLANWQRAGGIPADGEVLFPQGMAVAWKELAQRPRQLLVKRSDRVELRSFDDVLSLAAPC